MIRRFHNIYHYHLHMDSLYVNFLNGARVLTSFPMGNYDSKKPLWIMIHGNSSCAETFEKLMITLQNKVQMIAPDLPGCGESIRWDSYSCQSIGVFLKGLVEEHFSSENIYYIGHSLGGHLEAFIDVPKKGIALLGTPPLNSPEDFPNAFKPNEEARELLPFLSKKEAFTLEEATRFVSHTGVTGDLLQKMINYAISTDGAFRQGCLHSLATVRQRERLESRTDGSVVIIHGEHDGVVNLDYLRTFSEACLFEGKIHTFQTQHMTPILAYGDVATLLMRAFYL